MSAKRIIPCLDIKDGMTVKGVKFVELKTVGDPVELAQAYVEQGADELVFLDIAATDEGRPTLISLVNRISKSISIPFTVGGGIKSIHDVEEILNAGASRVSVSSAGVRNPQLIKNIADKFGSDKLVVAIDAKEDKATGEWIVTINGGKLATEKTLFDWAKEVEKLGAGEILFTSMDNDGVKQGFANKALAKLKGIIKIPIIASGGAGEMKHFKDAFIDGKADAALAASVFHYNEISIPELKEYLKKENIIINR